MNAKTCPACGATIESDHPEGLCPACLMKKALQTGAPVRAARPQCPACQSTLEEDARFCAFCGAPAPVAPATAQGDPLRSALEVKLKGQYRLVRLLGQGGMGSVYLARDLTLDREVAIKVVNADFDRQDVHDRFRREARTAAKLSHPNIVPLHAFGDVEGMPYFVMGYVRGESLAARLRRDGILPEGEARRMIAEIAGALEHAHRQGVVHRDIKPDNVLLEDESGRALLTDFGVAKALGTGDSLTAAGTVVGTPQYMSPEQAGGRADLDGRSDIYSLGVMAYAMLAGRLPFEGSTPAEVLTKHLTQEPPPLKSLARSVSDSTVQTVERCLAKDPAQRWPDARSLKLALGTIEETQLPDALQSAEGRGVLVVGFALIVTLVFVSLPYTTLGLPTSWILWGMSGFFVFLYLFALTRLRREGFSLDQSQRVIWQEPAWWPWWYPRALRRRGNVWERLPGAVQYLRWSVFAFVVYDFFLFFYLALLGSSAQPQIVSPAVAIAVALVFSSIRARRELRHKGLGPADSNSVMMMIPPSRVSFWARPHIAAILAPAPRPELGQRLDSPHDQLQSILRHANEMSGPLKPLGAQAAIAARQLLTSIDSADREIAELARNLEPGEEERLGDKVAALAPVSGRADEYAPMRLLLEKQLELIRSLSGRIEQAREDRNRRIEMLKALALHLASLRARCTEAPTELRSLSDRVRALCDDIGQQAIVQPQTVAGVGVDDPETFSRALDNAKRDS